MIYTKSVSDLVEMKFIQIEISASIIEEALQPKIKSKH